MREVFWGFQMISAKKGDCCEWAMGVDPQFVTVYKWKERGFCPWFFLVPYLTFAKTIWWKMRRRGIPLGFLFRLGGVDILYSERVTEI